MNGRESLVTWPFIVRFRSMPLRKRHDGPAAAAAAAADDHGCILYMMYVYIVWYAYIYIYIIYCPYMRCILLITPCTVYRYVRTTYVQYLYIYYILSVYEVYFVGFSALHRVQYIGTYVIRTVCHHHTATYPYSVPVCTYTRGPAAVAHYWQLEVLINTVNVVLILQCE